MTTTPSPLQLVASNGEVEYSRLIEPFQSPDSLVMRGIRSNAMTRVEAHDVAQVIADQKFKSGNYLEDAFNKARSILTLTGVVTDVNLLHESPTLLNTSLGALARSVSYQRLNDLMQAFEIEQLPLTGANSPDIFRYRSDANAAVASNPRTNVVRVLREIERTRKLPDQEGMVLSRTLGYVMHRQLVRSGLVPGTRK